MTKQQLACGYVQREYLYDDATVSLWMEHGVYHVRAHDFETHTRLFWDAFPTLTEARKRYALAVAELSEWSN